MSTRIDPQRGYLDNLARNGVDLRRRATRNRGRVYVDGSTADEAGSLALQELANEFGQRVVVRGESDHHFGVTYAPAGIS